MNEKDRKALLKVQQYAADCIPVYEMMAARTDDLRVRQAFEKICQEKQGHIRTLEKQTGEKVTPKRSDKAFVAGMRMIFGMRNTMNMMAQSEYDAGKDHEQMLKDHPELKQIAKDELRHGDTLMRLRKMAKKKKKK